MNANSKSTQLFFAPVIKRDSVFAVVSILIGLLIVASAVLLYTSLNGLTRVQHDIAANDTLTSDLAALGGISDISSKGWMASGAGAEQVRGILNKLRQNECCVLESDFAAGTLDGLNRTQIVLANEKQQIAAAVLNNDANFSLQADMVNAYGVSEKLARSVSDIFVNWSATFGQDAREKLIKTAEADTQNSLTLYTDAQANLDLAIDKIRTQVNGAYNQQQALKAQVPGLQLRTYGSSAALVVGILLMSAWFLLRRRSMQPQPVVQVAHSSGKHLKHKRNRRTT